MVKVGKWIAKHKYLIILISILLMIPSVIGMAKTRVNYDILSYLPDTLETIKGQDIMVDEYGMGAFFHGRRGKHGTKGCAKARRCIQRD